MKIDNRYICAAVGLLAMTGCSPLGLFNTVVPHDGASAVGPRDIAYGPDTRQKLDIYLPKEVGTDKPPMVVFLYGGSWRSGNRAQYAFAGRALAALGTVTVVPDYRVAPDHVFPAFIEDTAAAVAWAVDNAVAYGADPSRIYLVGHSAGAYNAALVALDRRYLEVRDIDPDVIAGVVGLSGPYDFDPAEWRVTRAAFAGSLEDPAVRPETLVTSEAPSMLLIHGADDNTVYVKNSRALATWLEAVNVPVTLVVYPDRGHAGTLLALSAPLKSGTPVLSEIAAFLDLEHDGGRTADRPAGSTPALSERVSIR